MSQTIKTKQYPQYFGKRFFSDYMTQLAKEPIGIATVQDITERKKKKSKKQTFFKCVSLLILLRCRKI
jgi:hypothetical protein